MGDLGLLLHGLNHGSDLLGRGGGALRGYPHLVDHRREAAACSPALAASIAALGASRLVCPAMSLITVGEIAFTLGNIDHDAEHHQQSHDEHQHVREQGAVAHALLDHAEHCWISASKDCGVEMRVALVKSAISPAD